MSAVRSGSVRALSKRKISIAVTPSATNTSSFEESRQDIKSQQQEHVQNSPKKVTVADFMSFSQTPYQLRSRDIPNTHKPAILTSEQLLSGVHIRPLLQQKNAKQLDLLVGKMFSGNDWSSIIYGLTRSEISLLIRTLVKYQLQHVANVDRFKAVLDVQSAKRTQKIADQTATNINHLYSALQRHEGFTFTLLELQTILSMESSNYQYPRAYNLIKYIESTRGALNTPMYHNLKLRVLAETATENWRINGSRPISGKSYHGALKMKYSFNQLIQEFSQSSSVNFTPNLQSHIETLSGLGKSGNLQECKNYINSIWDISLQRDYEPVNLLSKESQLYPTPEFLEAVVAIFALNSASNDAFQYIQKFHHYYKIDITGKTNIWRILIRGIEIETQEDVDRLVSRFASVWSFMKKENVRFTSALYNQRFDILSKVSKYDELSHDVQTIYENCLKQVDLEGKLRVQKVLTKYLKGVALGVYGNFKDIDHADELVMSYFQKYSINDEQFQELCESKQGIIELVDRENAQFEALQKQYDEEDDEGSLW